MEESIEIIIGGEKFQMPKEHYDTMISVAEMIIDYRKEKGDNYYFISENTVWVDTELNLKIDDDRYENGNYFDTEEEAYFIYNYQKLNRLLYLYSKRNGADVIDWHDNTMKKYYIDINKDKKIIEVNYSFHNTAIGEVVFCSRYEAKKAIKKYKDLFEKIYKGYTFNI